MSEYDIVKFQFFIGILYSVLYVYDKMESNELDEIKELFYNIHQKFILYYDIWNVIKSYIKYAPKGSKVNDMIDYFELYKEEYKYKNSYMIDHIGDNEILKLILITCNIDYADIDNVAEEEIEKNNRIDFEKILNSFQSNKYANLENKYQYNFDNAKSVLKKAKEIADCKENEYIINNLISKENIELFKQEIIYEAQKTTELIAILRTCGKVIKKHEKLKRVFGINQLISREFFFDDFKGIKTIAKNYGEAFPNGINNEILGEIIKNSKESSEDLSTILKNKQDLDNYIIITNYHEYYNNTNVDRKSECFIFNGNKIKTIINNAVNGMIVINKEDLPELQFCTFNEEYNKGNIIENFYCEVIDCSLNEKVRNDIIENEQWIKVKGTREDQDNYLKQQCILKIFMAYKVCSKEEIDSVIVNNKTILE